MSWTMHAVVRKERMRVGAPAHTGRQVGCFTDASPLPRRAGAYLSGRLSNRDGSALTLSVSPPMFVTTFFT